MSQVVQRRTSARRSVRAVAAVAVVGLGATAIVAAGGGTAAAADLPNAQAVGRLVDGAVGGNPIQAIADVQDARATAPGETSVQNPLDVKLLNALDLPLTGVVNIPTNPAVDAGVVNQVARANLNGASFGAAGAVADDGGASLGDQGTDTSFATIKLDASALGGGVNVPGIPALPGLPALPGGTGLASLGGINASLGAVYSNVGTRKGGSVITPQSGIASVKLSLGSPALGALLKQLKGVLGGADLGDLPITGLPTGGLPGLPTTGPISLSALLGLLNASLPAGCGLTDPLASSIDLKNGVVIDIQNATISVDVQKLIAKVLTKDISDLETSNFDLINFLVENLPDILSKGLSSTITGITTTLAAEFKKCVAALPGGLGTLLTTVTDQLLAGQKQITDAISGISDQLGAAGASGLAQLADGLKNVIDIGLNVQSGPGIEPRDTEYPYESNLEATPNQSTPVVENQTLVRAVEINLLNAAAAPGGLPNLPGVPGLNSANVKQLAGAAQAARPVARAPGDGAVNVALANSAAGPSNVDDDTTPPSTSVPPTVVPSTNVPTGIPAGQAGGEQNGGSPVLPLVAILTLLAVSGGAFWQLRLRGGSHHA